MYKILWYILLYVRDPNPEPVEGYISCFFFPVVRGWFLCLGESSDKSSKSDSISSNNQQLSRKASYQRQIDWQKDNPHRERREFGGAAMAKLTDAHTRTHTHTHTHCIDDGFHISPILPSSVCPSVVPTVLMGSTLKLRLFLSSPTISLFFPISSFLSSAKITLAIL